MIHHHLLGWSEARKVAFKQMKSNPNMYFYRFNAPGEKQKNGIWSADEKKLFLERLKEVGVDYRWGYFSMAIPGRVGYQCANFYRRLIKEGEIKDDNYVLDDKGEPKFVNRKRKLESKDSVTPSKPLRVKSSRPSQAPNVLDPSSQTSKKRQWKQATLDGKPLKASPQSERKRKEALKRKELRKQSKEQQKKKEAEEKLKRDEEFERKYKQSLEGKEITSGVFLGNSRVAQNWDWLETNNIRSVVNVSKEVKNFFEGKLHYKRIPIGDCARENVSRHFDDCASFIRESLQRGNVLVHCHEGRSRSVAVLAGYLMQESGWDLSKTVKHLEEISKTVNMNDGFKRQLMKHEMKLTNISSHNFFELAPRRSNSRDSISSPRQKQKKPLIVSLVDSASSSPDPDASLPLSSLEELPSKSSQSTIVETVSICSTSLEIREEEPSSSTRIQITSQTVSPSEAISPTEESASPLTNVVSQLAESASSFVEQVSPTSKSASPLVNVVSQLPESASSFVEQVSPTSESTLPADSSSTSKPTATSEPLAPSCSPSQNPFSDLHISRLDEFNDDLLTSWLST